MGDDVFLKNFLFIADIEEFNDTVTDSKSTLFPRQSKYKIGDIPKLIKSPNSTKNRSL